MAAVAGSYYLKSTVPQFKTTRFVVYFLWFTVFVELLGSYAPIAYFSEYTFLESIVGTPFANNFWLFNIFNVLNYSFFSFYFISILKNKFWKNIFFGLIISFVVISILAFVFTPSFFKPSSQLLVISGTLLLFLSIIMFYFELLRSDYLLQLKRFLPFYISVGVLVFNLCVTPIEILSQYFSIADGNELFVKLHINVLLFANIFIYGTFILGFLICSRKKKSSY